MTMAATIRNQIIPYVLLLVDAFRSGCPSRKSAPSRGSIQILN